MSNYTFSPPVKEFNIEEDLYCSLDDLKEVKCSENLDLSLFKSLEAIFLPLPSKGLDGFKYIIGEDIEYNEKIESQGYVIIIQEKGILIQADDKEGFHYGIDTFLQILDNKKDGNINCMRIYDYPILKNRGLMLDISRGKVYKLEYLLNLVDILRQLRFNKFQLYIEHTFKFKSHPEISKGSGAITSQEIKILQEKCKENGIELQANLQSLGHMNRILTREDYLELAESDMYWSIDTTSEASYKLLDNMYREFLPLFESPWLNICSDEPYDLGKGKSACQEKEVGELYFDHLLKLHDMAAKYGKKIMLFGDVVKLHPQYAEKMPKDIIYIDWIYDPKDEYASPKLFQDTGIPYWVSPGTGNWNTLFPRLKGSLTNISNLTLEGIDNGAQGMLLTDWNDHGGYAQPSTSYYSYAYAGAVSWLGEKPVDENVDRWIDRVLDIPGYSEIIHKMGSIYDIVPIWSKNRSQCVMALFDEPIFGNSIRGPEPHKDLVAYDLELPEEVEPVYDRHSQHPLRPYFSITKEAQEEIVNILVEVKPLIENLETGLAKSQLNYTLSAFELMSDKLDLSRKIIEAMEKKNIRIPDFILLEDELRILIARFVRLQMEFMNRWFEVAKASEIEISVTYFAHIISRLDYLRDWLSIQRENFNKEGVDWEFKTYNQADYGTLPTY